MHIAQAKLHSYLYMSQWPLWFLINLPPPFELTTILNNRGSTDSSPAIHLKEVSTPAIHLKEVSTPASSSANNALMAPLADLVRPTSIEEFVGQEDVIGKNSFLRTILETGDVPSLIFWGPPGCGKVRAILGYFSEHLAISLSVKEDDILSMT